MSDDSLIILNGYNEDNDEWIPIKVDEDGYIVVSP